MNENSKIELTGAEVVHHTRGGARLAEQLNPKTKTGAKTQAALENEFRDYVVLQEMSNGPITSRNSFLKNVGRLCSWIKEEGAAPLLFSTWAYQKGSQALADMEMSYEEMTEGLYKAYRVDRILKTPLLTDDGLPTEESATAVTSAEAALEDASTWARS